LDAIVNWGIGKYQRRRSRLEELTRQAAHIDSMAGRFRELTDHGLQERLFEYRDYFRRELHADPEILQPALAAVREAADRCVGLRAFPVQLVGALALHRGCLAEMATGEGRAAGLAAVPWTKRHPHHHRRLPRPAGCRLAASLHLLRRPRVCHRGAGPEERQEYGRDVTYHEQELLADFLVTGCASATCAIQPAA
jgi:hypothetical protein